MMDFTEKQWLSHTIFHPFDGFEDMRWKKAGSLSLANIIILLWFAGDVLFENFYGKQFVMVSIDEFSIVPYIVKTVILFLAWTLSNCAVCTIIDGEGSIKKIYIYSAYALVPYVSQLYIQVILSHILIRDEIIFIIIPEVIGVLWSLLLMFMAIKAVHQLSVSKTLFSITFTLVGMLIILVLLVLVAALFQQIYSFIASVFVELEYRLKV